MITFSSTPPTGTPILPLIKILSLISVFNVKPNRSLFSKEEAAFLSPFK